MKTPEEKKKYNADRQREYRKKNVFSVRARERKYYENNRDKFNARRIRYKSISKNCYLKRTYGMTLEQYNRLLHEQLSRCAICGSDNPKSFKNVSFHVDHDHITGKVRGLLCSNCNMALGLLKDDISILSKTIIYLTKHKD